MLPKQTLCLDWYEIVSNHLNLSKNSRLIKFPISFVLWQMSFLYWNHVSPWKESKSLPQTNKICTCYWNLATEILLLKLNLLKQKCFCYLFSSGPGLFEHSHFHKCTSLLTSDCQTYLDNAGASLYCQSQMDAVHKVKN